MQTFLIFSAWIDRLNDRIGRAACWLTLFMVLIGSYNAVVRYLGRSLNIHLSSNAYLELQWYFFSGLFLLGAAYTLRHNAHVRVDVLFSRLSPRAQAWINFLGAALFVIPFCLLMLWVSWAPVRNSWMILEISPNADGLPRYPIKTLIPVAFLLLLLQGLSEAVKQWAYLRGLIPSATEPYDPGET